MPDQESTALIGRGQGPLAGVVVADFTRVLAGPYCTMLLGDLGATVIKVEGPGGDDSRQWTPPSHQDVGTYYMSVNRSKHSLVLDFRDPEDLATAYALLDRADVFIENWKPGGLEKFGLDAAAVARRWPHLVHASITGFGTGAGASMPGYDLLVQAMSGLMEVTGSSDGPPQRAGVAMFDVITGLHAAVGVLAGLYQKAAEGSSRGQHLQLDLLSSALSGLVNQTTGYSVCGAEPRRHGNDHPSLFPYGPFRASDREIIICIGNNAQFARLAEVLGQPELAQDPRFLGVPERNANREELRAIMEQAMSAMTADECFAALQARGIPCAPILTVGEGVAFAQELGLEPVVEVGTGEEKVPLIKNPISFDDAPSAYDKAPPALDQDRENVLAWLETAPKRGEA